MESPHEQETLQTYQVRSAACRVATPASHIDHWFSCKGLLVAKRAVFLQSIMNESANSFDYTEVGN